MSAANPSRAATATATTEEHTPRSARPSGRATSICLLTTRLVDALEARPGSLPSTLSSASFYQLLQESQNGEPLVSGRKSHAWSPTRLRGE
ncbi:hypothetical protein IG631_09524 [Alternaria alternata]|nr:hypothetical protein IG631_09524 [Alternaria alternata]